MSDGTVDSPDVVRRNQVATGPDAPCPRLALEPYLGADTPATITAIGNLDILREPATALLCSVRCPGDVILRTYDLARSLRERGTTVMSGFHSPMEQECLRVLLRGSGPIIVCAARSIERMRLPAAWKGPLEDGKLLVLSPFEAVPHRITALSARARNRFAAALADEIFIIYAEPGGSIERLCGDALRWGKPVRTLDVAANANVINMGATAIPRLES